MRSQHEWVLHTVTNCMHVPTGLVVQRICTKQGSARRSLTTPCGEHCPRRCRDTDVLTFTGRWTITDPWTHEAPLIKHWCLALESTKMVIGLIISALVPDCVSATSDIGCARPHHLPCKSLHSRKVDGIPKGPPRLSCPVYHGMAETSSQKALGLDKQPRSAHNGKR